LALALPAPPAARLFAGEPRGGPPAEQPADTQVGGLARAARDVRHAVLFVGHPDHGCGTGFVISKEHRLVATNAHVADIYFGARELFAYANGSDRAYKVKSIWYHPGVARTPNVGLVVRSADPWDGDVYVRCPDVAVLQMEDDGAPFPDALPLAGAKEIDDLFGVAVGMIGFPSHDLTRWPGPGRPAGATFHQGMVSRVTDFAMDASAPPRLLQYVQHTVATFGGFSGSPLFTADGRVVAVHNAVRIAGEGGSSTRISQGVRVDALWELIAHHRLDAWLPLGMDRRDLSVERYLRPDPQTEKYHRAVALASQANTLMGQKKYAEAVNRCNDAIAEQPAYGPPYLLRSRCYGEYWIAQQDAKAISAADMVKYAELALADAKRFVDIDSDNARAYVTYALAMTNYGHALNLRPGAKPDYARSQAAAELMTKLLGLERLSDRVRASAHNCRAVARFHARDKDGALADYTAAIRLDPSPGTYRNRARLWTVYGRADLAAKDWEQARQLEAKG